MPDNTNRLELIISVKDDGSVVIDTVKKKIDDVGQTTEQASAKGASGLKGLKAGWLELAAGVTAGYFTIKKGIDVITNLVNVAAEAEQIEKRAAFQIETWGYKFQEVKPYVDAFAESIMRTTRFSDEMARQGLGQMMRYTSSVEQGMEGVRLAMDMSTQTGFDLQTSLRYVGMAMNGEIEMLGRMDPAFKNLNNVLDENASKSEKAAFGLERLNKMFGGAGQADLKTYSGQVSQLKNDWDELKESMGRILMPLAAGGVKTGSRMIGWLTPEGTLKTELNYWQQIIELLNVEDPYNTKAIEEAQNKVAALTNTLGLLEEKIKGAKAGLKDITPQEIIKAPEKDWIKKWVADFDDLTYSYERLGIISQKTLTENAAATLSYMESIKKAYGEGRASVVDYMNALKAANDAMKKLTGEDQGKKREEAWDKNAETIKGISKDEEGWLKKVNKANDELFQTLKDLKNLEVPTYADVGPMEREVNAMKEKLRAEGLVIPVTTEGGTRGGGGEGGTSWTDYVSGNTEFFQGGKKAFDDMNDSFQDFSEQWGQGLDIPISIFGIGSSRKPISEKIREIIGEFGGLDKALSGMEAEINVAELSAEYSKLDNKLQRLERVWPELSSIMTSFGADWMSGGAMNYERQLTSSIDDIKSQMGILQMKMDYERLRGYGGSYQAGAQYVPQTGLYMLHEGERVTSKNVSVGGITIKIESRGDPKEMANELIHVLKYRLSGELRDLL